MGRQFNLSKEDTDHVVKNGQKLSVIFDFKKCHPSFKISQTAVISISEFLKEDAPQWMREYLNKRVGFFN